MYKLCMFVSIMMFVLKIYVKNTVHSMEHKN